MDEESDFSTQLSRISGWHSYRQEETIGDFGGWYIRWNHDQPVVYHRFRIGAAVEVVMRRWLNWLYSLRVTL